MSADDGKTKPIVSQRGVVFFRKQDDVTNDIQKELVQRLGELTGKPSTSKLHIHPVSNAARGDDSDNEISVISSVRAKKLYIQRLLNLKKSQSAKSQWHSDITFEPVPSDYALLRLTELPESGGGKFSLRRKKVARHYWIKEANGVLVPQIRCGHRDTSCTTASRRP